MFKRLVLFVLLCAALAAGGYVNHYGVPSPEGLQSLVQSIAKPAPTAAPAGAPAPPPPEVGVIEAKPAEVAIPVEYAGRVAGFRNVEIRPRVSGLLLHRAYDEGAKVEENQLLFEIDPATYKLALIRAEAQHQQAQATLRQAEENHRRVSTLAERAVATDRQLDEAISQRDQARANIQLTEAEIQNARLNLDYTKVTAPVGGVTALQSPPIGTLILAQQTILTHVTQLDPAYVNFSFTDEDAAAFRNLNRSRAKPVTEKDLTVELRFGNGTSYAEAGRIDTAAQRVDPETGTIEARALFPNKDGILLPGQFVRVVIRGVTIPEAIVIPNMAVSQGPQGPSVYVVAENGTAEARPVRLGAEVASGWIVEDGVKAGERVVVDGVIRVKPGAPVRAVALEIQPERAEAAKPGTVR